MRVSAVIPAHDTGRKVFAQALDSLRATGAASEIVIVDDRTTATETMVELQRQSELGAVVVQSRGPYQALARATGVHLARGDYILNMDADDTIHGALCGPLAALNLTRNAGPHEMPHDAWDYVEAPSPIQWGAVVRADLARYLATDTEPREEDIGWGYRAMLAAWRDGLEINRDTGLRYDWRPPGDRSTVTSRGTKDEQELACIRAWYLAQAFDHLDLCTQDRLAMMLWRGRRKRETAMTESATKPGARVDVHVLSYSRPASWLRRTMDSLADEPCNIHCVVGGFRDSIGAARAHAFTMGNAEYVSFVDDDDLAVPGVMAQLVAHLDARPEHVGAYTDVEHFHGNGEASVERKGRPWRPIRQLLYCPEVTHLKVMRRSAVEEHLEELARWPTYEEYVLCGLLCGNGGWHHVPVVGARKRFTPASGSSMRLTSNALWRRAVALVTPVIMRAA